MKLINFIKKSITFLLVIIVYPLSIILFVDFMQGELLINLFWLVVIIVGMTWSLVRTARVVAFYWSFKDEKNKENLIGE